MGYGRTPKSIERTKLLLDEMVNSDETIEWKFDNPRHVAYKLWEAIRFAIKSKEIKYKHYTKLLDKYKIRVVEPDTLIAEIRDDDIIKPKR